MDVPASHRDPGRGVGRGVLPVHPARRPAAPTVVAAAFAAGSVPFSNLAARLRADVDLRDVGSGTVSGSALFEVAGFGPLAIAGVCDVAKGAVGPLLAGRDRPGLAAAAAAAAVAGHNWSPVLRGAGGRGISPALGALLVHHWPGVVVLATGMVLGRAAGRTALGSLVAYLALAPVLGRARGRDGAMLGLAVVAPLVAKRIAGNRPLPERSWRAAAQRLLFDHDSETPEPDAVAGDGPRVDALAAHGG